MSTHRLGRRIGREPAPRRRASGCQDCQGRGCDQEGRLKFRKKESEGEKGRFDEAEESRTDLCANILRRSNPTETLTILQAAVLPFLPGWVMVLLKLLLATVSATTNQQQPNNPNGFPPGMLSRTPYLFCRRKNRG